MPVPKISIITAVYNAQKDIEKTIRSVINQSYLNIEYIIIDGGSTDGTLDIIKKYDPKISHWVSESDNGVFDAMNKGIQYATGDWINFMNAGDYFVDMDVISNIDFESSKGYGLVYGNTEYESHGIKRPFRITSLQYGMIMACHQSMFFNYALLKNMLKYSSKFKLICDYDLVCKIVKHKYPTKYINQTIAHYMGGGLSAAINWEARKARYYYIFKYYQLSGVVHALLESSGIISLPKRIE
ncbi:MAG: glycosyltransferase family 2 protein [Bacteroidota bacterium]|nr:glycosyltransferase family 2 protein [Bacteroidota bacterium]